MDSLIMLINSRLPQLPMSERKIANYILDGKSEVLHQNVSDVAKATGASTSAVIRLCKSLGVPGFSELKMMLARDVFANNHIDREDDSSLNKLDSVVQNTINSSIATLNDLQKIISMESMEKAVSLIIKAEYIGVFGIGLSNIISFDFSHKMLRLGFSCGYEPSNQMQIMMATNMKPGNVGVIISHSGNTREVIKATSLMKENKVKIIGITGNPGGMIAKLSDVVLFTTLSEPLDRQGASSSRIAQLVLIDSLFSMIVKTDPDFYLKKLKSTFDAYREPAK